MSKPVLIRFPKACRPYNANETAGFSASQARRLVNQGAAEYVNPPKGFDKNGKREGKGEEKGAEGLRHNGGGWYELLEFNDADGAPVRVKGLDNAVAAREELIAQELAKQVPAGSDDDGDSENPDQDDGDE